MEVNENLYYLIRYIAEFHKAPKSREVYEGRKIGQYFQNIKKGSQEISAEDAKFLIRCGVKLATENPQNKVHEKFLILVEFFEKFGKPIPTDIYKGVRLHTFIQNIKSGNTKLNSADKKKFDELFSKYSC